MKPKDFKYIVKNNICLFKRGPLSQSWGGFLGQDLRFTPIGGSFGEGCDQEFTSTEQWAMAMKAVIMGDDESLYKILKLKSPSKIKEIGSQIKNYDDALWDKHKKRVMYYGNLWKFSQNPELKKFLLSFPRHTIFAKADTSDLVLGIGLHINDSDALNIYKWRGQNLLGEAIQRVHRELHLPQSKTSS